MLKKLLIKIFGGNQQKDSTSKMLNPSVEVQPLSTSLDDNLLTLRKTMENCADIVFRTAMGVTSAEFAECLLSQDRDACWQEVKDSWREAFQEAEIEVVVQTKVLNTGQKTKKLEIKD